MTAALIGQIAHHLLPGPPAGLGIAVSGGSDSMALLHLLAQFVADHDMSLHVVTVDHGLRPEAAAEAAMVAAACGALGLPHDILHWQGWDGTGNLQDQARRARYGLIAQWARARGVMHVALGHTLDDQAETVLMRLARGAGVDGLSGMAARHLREGVTWLRPLLAVRRSDLRDYLRDRRQGWAEDPSNVDPKYMRVQARAALAQLAPLGIDAAALAQVAANMAPARAALDQQTATDLHRIGRIKAGAVVLQRQSFAALPEEIARRMLVAALGWISGAEYPPRRAPVLALIAALKSGKGGTLDGCRLLCRKSDIWICREWAAVRDLEVPAGAIWDGRWRLEGPGDAAYLVIRALGSAGLAQCHERRATGLPHAVLLSTPGVWAGTELVAAPLALWAKGWQAAIETAPDAMFSPLLSH